MNRRTIIKLTGAGVLLAGLTLCGLPGSGSYHVRMTVEVDTPHGLKSGAGVMEVEIHQIFPVPGKSSTNSGGIHGQAVVVDLPNGLLFALLKNSGTGQPLDVQVTQALAPDAHFEKDGDYPAAVARLGGWSVHAKAELPKADWPLMVRFRDINDPKSVEAVDPEAIGVKRIWVETTRDAVTTGIEKRIPWLITAENFHYQGTSAAELYPTDPRDIRRGQK